MGGGECVSIRGSRGECAVGEGGGVPAAKMLLGLAGLEEGASELPAADVDALLRSLAMLSELVARLLLGDFLCSCSLCSLVCQRLCDIFSLTGAVSTDVSTGSPRRNGLGSWAASSGAMLGDTLTAHCRAGDGGSPFVA